MQVMAFRRFCDTVVFNYPALLQPHNPSDVLQPRPPTADRWRVRPSASGLRLWRNEVGDGWEDLGDVRTSADDTKLARATGASFGRFDQHPSLDAFPPLWTPCRPPALTTRAAPPVCAGAREVAARQARAIASDELIGSALASVSWKMLARLPASSSGQRILFHKLKGLRLSGWDRFNERRGCPHCPEADDDGGHAFHTMWRCPAAQQLWSLLLSFWQLLSDALVVVQWHHHVRAFNKMVDAAANVATNTRSSIQTFHPTARPDWLVLQDHLQGDITQWEAYTHPGSSSLG